MKNKNCLADFGSAHRHKRRRIFLEKSLLCCGLFFPLVISGCTSNSVRYYAGGIKTSDNKTFDPFDSDDPGTGDLLYMRVEKDGAVEVKFGSFGDQSKGSGELDGANLSAQVVIRRNQKTLNLQGQMASHHEYKSIIEGTVTSSSGEKGTFEVGLMEDEDIPKNW